MATGDVYKASMLGSAGGQDMVVTSHWRMKSGADPVATIGAYLTSEFVTLVADLQDSQYSWTGIEVRQLAIPPTGADYLTGYPITGSLAHGISDLRSAMVVSCRTAFLGRSYRGRMYIPGWSSNNIADGLFNTTVRDDVQTIMDDILAGVGVGGANGDLLMGVWSPTLGNIPPAPGHPTTGYNLTAGFHGITDFIVDEPSCTQRRRGVRVT